jgi:transposase
VVKEGYSELIAVEGTGTKSSEGNRIMGRPSSLDLRERVIPACEAGEASQAAIARRFPVSETAVSCWSGLAREEGRREPKAHGRGLPSVLDEADGAVLTALVAPRNDAPLEE